MQLVVGLEESVEVTLFVKTVGYGQDNFVRERKERYLGFLERSRTTGVFLTLRFDSHSDISTSL